MNDLSKRLKNINNIINNNLVEPLIDNKYEYKNNIKDVREIISKKYLDFNNVFNILKCKLLYKKSGSTGHTFKGLIDNNIDNCIAVKVVAYSKKDNYGSIYFCKRPENAEILMIKLLSYFVRNRQTPHIILPITTFYTSIDPFLPLVKNNKINNKKFEQFIERYENNEYYPNVSILISEWANSGDLLEYLKNNYKTFTLLHWRVLFFQLISVLAIIHAKYPGFRHNDLKANNILVDKINQNDDEIYTYEINKQVYKVPNMGFLIKLWDFDFATIPGIVDNSKVEADWTNRINVKPIQNRYYDIHYFFNTLIKKAFFPEILTDKCVPKKVKDFINRVVPDKYKSGSDISDKGRLLIDEEYIIPDNILKHDRFFNCFRMK
jgi:serine/threonine protein kinase